MYDAGDDTMPRRTICLQVPPPALDRANTRNASTVAPVGGCAWLGATVNGPKHSATRPNNNDDLDTT